MLCEGVLLYLLLVKVFGGSVEEKVKYFYLFGWGKYCFVLSPYWCSQTWQISKLLPKSILTLLKIDFSGFPAIILVTSLAATRAVGYGKIAHACWLDVDSGLIWAFIAPALTIILVSENSSTLSHSVRSMNLKCFVPKSSTKRKSTNSFHSFMQLHFSLPPFTFSFLSTLSVSLSLSKSLILPFIRLFTLFHPFAFPSFLLEIYSLKISLMSVSAAIHPLYTYGHFPTRNNYAGLYECKPFV